MESPPLELFKRQLDLVLGDVLWWFRGYSGCAGWMTGLNDLKVSSSLDDSQIL